MIKWQVRSNAFTRKNKPSLSVVEADSLQLVDGCLVFMDLEGVVIAVVQKDSWNDVVRISKIA